MTNPTGLKLSDLFFRLPTQLPGPVQLATPLVDLWTGLLVEAIEQVVEFPPLSTPDPATDAPMTEEQALALLEWFEGEVEVIPPDPPQVVLPTIITQAINTGTRVLSLTLKALSDVKVALPGLDAFSFVLNPDAFQAKVKLTEAGASLECTPKLALQLSDKVLIPVKATSNGNYERDPSRPAVRFDLASATIKFDTRTGLDISSALKLNAQITQPIQIAGTEIVIESADIVLDLSDGDNKCLAIKWTETKLAQWLARISPSLASGNAASATMAARIILGDAVDAPAKEVRVDIQVTGAGLSFGLPGVDVSLPTLPLVSLILGAGGRGLNHISLIASVKQEANKNVLLAQSTFAWGRGGDRELNQNADAPASPPLFKVEINTANLDEANLLSVVLMDLDVVLGGLPNFLQQLQTPLAALDFNQTSTLCAPTPFDPISLKRDAWSGELEIAKDLFKLPFLENKGDDPNSNQFQQYLTVARAGETPDQFRFKLDFDEDSIAFPMRVELKFGTIVFGSEFDLKFNWRTLSLKVEHLEGIEMLSDTATFNDDHLGLTWRLKGNSVTRNGKQRYHFFTLVTKDYNYGVQMAQGAQFELEYNKLSDEPIAFIVKNFALSPKGVTLTAEVSDRPARLNGIDTRFRFNGSRIEIVENNINDLTLQGSGPMPPALVGDAMVDVALQFKQIDGSFTLVAGSATLKGNKLLHCKNTRFEFAIDAIGLKFVNQQGKFHLYFTLTGMAQFALGAGDDVEGPLALLPKIKIQMVECPLCGDAKVLAQHIKFLIEMPKPISFSFLGCFEFELRAIGFVPQAKEFNGDAAMQLSGQVFFAQGGGDILEVKVDFHNLFIGLPAPGGIFPRLYFKEIAVNLKVGEAFKVHGAVAFIDEPDRVGFEGEGMMEMAGMPSLAASFGFLRVRRDEHSAWLRAWFIYLEIRKVSFMIPVIQIYLREVGLGFGYRYTIASIKAADRENDVKKLLTELKALSRTQGDLSKRDRWAVDLEEPGEDARWTIVLRAMISQNSASQAVLQYNESGEENIPNLFLIDAIIAFRSDLTFFMAARAWINTNYHEFLNGDAEVRENPFFSGFILLSVRQKRFLAHLTSNPNAYIGEHPPLPDLVKSAIRGIRFSATLLVQPGLFQLDLGWPNNLGFSLDLGFLKVECRGGFIFRISTEDFVIGISFTARGRLEIKAELDLGLIGVWVEAIVEVAYGTRFIARLKWAGENQGFLIYGAIGLELMIKLSFGFWIKIPLVFTTIKISFSFTFSIGFTAALEGAISNKGVGMRGSGTLSIGVMGHSLQVSASFAINEGVVTSALEVVEEILNLGLEATDAPTDLPGMGAPAALRALPRAGIWNRAALRQPEVAAFDIPDYRVFIIRSTEKDGWSCFTLLPRGELHDKDTGLKVGIEAGFLPPPPTTVSDGLVDFELSLPSFSGTNLHHYNPITNTWDECTNTVSWRADWLAKVAEYTVPATTTTPAETQSLTLADWLTRAYLLKERTNPQGQITGFTINRDPDVTVFKTQASALEDARVQNPTETAFESAVRGAAEQFTGSPFFKFDPTNPYDVMLRDAFRRDNTIYHPSGTLTVPNERNQARRSRQIEDKKHNAQDNQRAIQLRGMVVNDIVRDLRTFFEGLEGLSASAALPVPPTNANGFASIPFNMGLVFAFTGATPDWLDSLPDDANRKPKIKQRRTPADTAPDAETHLVETFNIAGSDFSVNPPEFRRVRHYTDANTIAITWDLAWTKPLPGAQGDAVRGDPDQHLAHYEVRRRALDGGEREVMFTVKPAQTLHLETGVLNRLKPRFNITDNFNHETLEDQAALPLNGRSYLYTITPIDFCDKRGRPLTVLATRYPNQPPPVPTDAEMAVVYRESDLPRPETRVPADTPKIVQPHHIDLSWTTPTQNSNQPRIIAAKTYLLFRKDNTLPIGSYGLDGVSQGARVTSRPASNARPLPTDIRVELTDEVQQDQNGVKLLAALREAIVLPAEGWRPESWLCFIQTESANGVRSSLATVALRLRIELLDGANKVVASEERQLPELEWLAQPIQKHFLPPHDARAQVGVAHFPMPSAGNFKFAGNLSNIGYAPHPQGIRCIRFRWNQGASENANYPLDLNAGYHLYQLDVDAVTDEDYATTASLKRSLRHLQEVQMLPAEDLLLAPADTLAVNQWEAWYPSAIRRKRDEAAMKKARTELSRGPWYSWRDSRLEWPPCPLGDFFGYYYFGALRSNTFVQMSWDGKLTREKRMHTFLERVVNALAANGLYVDLQLFPPDQPGKLADLMRVTAPKSDPYGWGVLQRFGLSIAFTLRNKTNGELISRAEAMTAFQIAIKKVLEDNSNPIVIGFNNADFARFLHVEMLFQPSRAVELSETAPDENALLALMQISLRPAVKQWQRYWRYTLEDPHGQLGEIATLSITTQSATSLVNLSAANSGQNELGFDGSNSAKQFIYKMPNSHTLALLMRAELAPTITARQDGNPLPAGVTETLSPLPVTDEASSYFVVSDAMKTQLSADFAAYEDNAADKSEWRDFRLYAESLSGDDPRIQVPTDVVGIQALLDAYMEWTQRFFDYGGDVDVAAGQTGVGPWLATAYPRASTPAFATPDESGRLKYDHLIEDPWAHNYRHYIAPYSRYDVLWQNVWQSPSLYPPQQEPKGLGRPSGSEDPIETPELRRIPNTYPDGTLDGGLDVVMDRTKPVDRPLILRSARLDPPAQPGQPVPPGAMWEVIIARHTEQAMIERNQSLARQVAFRTQAFTLLRRFGYQWWVKELGNLLPSFNVQTRTVQNHTPALPNAYPDSPDHIPLDKNPLLQADALSLDLPNRLGDFQQGATVLQWQGLPFFYEHRLLAIAQTTNTVSDTNDVIQKNFEYRAPTPSAEMEAELGNALRIEIPLRRFWDSLPPDAQAQWPSERPDATDAGTGTRQYAALPDPDVVYQIVEVFNGNIEVQVECLYGEYEVTTSTVPIKQRGYSIRQLGKDFIGKTLVLEAPNATQPEYALSLSLTSAMQNVTVGAADVVWARPADLPISVRNKLKFDAAQNWKLVWEGPLSAEEKAALLALPGEAAFTDAVARLAQAAEKANNAMGAYVIEPAPLPPFPAPAAVAARIKVIEDAARQRYTALQWVGGAISDAELQAFVPVVNEWAISSDLRTGVDALLAQLEAQALSKDLPPPRPTVEDLPEVLRQRLVIGLRLLSLSPGRPTDAERVALNAIMNNADFGDDEFHAALKRLLEAIDADRQQPLVEPDDKLKPENLPPEIKDQLVQDIAARLLIWKGPAPTDVQYEVLRKLMETTDNGLTREALLGLLQQIDQPQQARIEPMPARPRQADLPASIREQLLIERRLVSWRGRLRSDAQLIALNALTGDGAFVNAISEIATTMKAAAFSVPIDIAQRPTQPTLPATLSKKLLLGAQPIACGLLSLRDAVTLRNELTLIPEKRAIERLYRAAIKSLLNGRELQVRARRGSATPSDRLPIAVSVLPEVVTDAMLNRARVLARLARRAAARKPAKVKTVVKRKTVVKQSTKTKPRAGRGGSKT